MVTGKAIDALLREFGHSGIGDTPGYYCKLNDCFICEFFYRCHRQRGPPQRKDRGNFDHIIRNLGFGILPKKYEFHMEVKQKTAWRRRRSRSSTRTSPSKNCKSWWKRWTTTAHTNDNEEVGKDRCGHLQSNRGGAKGHSGGAQQTSQHQKVRVDVESYSKL